jgi:hypothetical protein
MRWSFDRVGFPMMMVRNPPLRVHVLPVMKVQYERFLAEPGAYGDGWYEQVLAVSPRGCWRDARIEEYESLLMTATLLNEWTAFGKWLGPGFGLPSTDKWRALDRALAAAPFNHDELKELQDRPELHPAANAMLSLIVARCRPRDWGRLMLFRGGVLEWVRHRDGFGGLGAPRPEFQAVIVNPQRDDPVRPVREGRFRFFGARMIDTSPTDE